MNEVCSSARLDVVVVLASKPDIGIYAHMDHRVFAGLKGTGRIKLKGLQKKVEALLHQGRLYDASELCAKFGYERIRTIGVSDYEEIKALGKPRPGDLFCIRNANGGFSNNGREPKVFFVADKCGDKKDES